MQKTLNVVPKTWLNAFSLMQTEQVI